MLDNAIQEESNGFDLEPNGGQNQVPNGEPN